MKTRAALPLFAIPFLPLPILADGAEPGPWKKQIVTTDFLTEGISVGDLDGDGKKDLVAGAYWFKGPDFKERKQFKTGGAQPVKTYQEDSFLSWVEDFNADGKNDILMASHPGKNLTLYLNPGETAGNWPAHVVMTEAATECPEWTDLDGDGKKEFVCMQGGKFGYAEADWRDVTKPWKFIAISEKRTGTPYVHGLGVGDLSGDGKPDILAKDGWFEQPAGEREWIWHPEPFAEAGGAQMLVFDMNEDGVDDVVTSVNAHGYGLDWFEVSRKGGKTTFTRHVLMPTNPAEKGTGGVQFSQLHAMATGTFEKSPVALEGFVTGKRYYAHNGNDPGAEDPAVLVLWFRSMDNGHGTYFWMPQVIDKDSGVGCQVVVDDLDGDGRDDIISGSKKGVFVFRQ